MLGFLEEQGVSKELRQAIAAFRAQNPVAEADEARVPAPTFHYVGREVWEQAATALLCGQNLLLTGSKATGKNVLAQDLACAFGRPEWDVSFHIDMDASYLIGTDTLVDGEVSFRPGPIACCAQRGGFGVLDEINMARSEALAVLHATLDHRRIIDVPGYELIRLAPATRFIGTMNVGYLGTRELNEALASRFTVITMPALSVAELEGLIAARYPGVQPAERHQLALLFDEIRLKCANGEIGDKALDLRGLFDAIELAQAGLPVEQALRNCISNKVFDAFERGLVEDVIAARLPHGRRLGRLFGDRHA